jgi:hypothetical protein
MPKSHWTPEIATYGADQTVYLVVDRFGALGTVYRETEVERVDLEAITADFMSGQFNDPIRVVAFNTLERCLKTFRSTSRSKSRPAATFKAIASPSISVTLSGNTPVGPGSGF